MHTEKSLSAPSGMTVLSFLFGVDFIGNGFERLHAFFDQFISAELDLDQTVTAVAQMDSAVIIVLYF